MVSELNIPGVDFPIRFRQRLEDEKTLEFRLAENPDSGRVELSVLDADNPVFTGLPLFLWNPIGISMIDSAFYYYGATEERDGPELKVTEERLQSGTVVIRAARKP